MVDVWQHIGYATVQRIVRSAPINGERRIASKDRLGEALGERNPTDAFRLQLAVHFLELFPEEGTSSLNEFGVLVGRFDMHFNSFPVEVHVSLPIASNSGLTVNDEFTHRAVPADPNLINHRDQILHRFALNLCRFMPTNTTADQVEDDVLRIEH